MTTSIDISPDDLEIVQQILAEHVPELEVRAFGSRATWTAREYSDLDLVLMTAEPLDIKRLGDMQEAFVQSDLPFHVDIVDWASTSENFRRIIEEKCVVVQAINQLDGWNNMPFSNAVLINPPVSLKRGSIYPFVDMASINSNCRSTEPSLQRKFHGSGSKFKSGDTLMARITPCLENGKIARYFAPTNMPKVAHGSTEFIVIRGRPGFTETEYAYYLTQWRKVRNYATTQMEGTSGRQRVPIGSLDYLTIPIPPLHQQRTIANILGTLDDKIELNRQMSETLEEMAQALFKSWFVDFDPVRAKMEGRWRRGESLPGLPADLWELFPDQSMDSELGHIPKGWNVSNLGTLAKITSGKRPTVQFLRITQDAHVPLWGGNGPMGFVPVPLFRKPILLTGRVGTLGSVFRITSCSWPSDNTLVIIAKLPTYFEFLYFRLYQIDFSSLNRGSTQPLLTQADIKIQQFCLPEPKILQYFHTIVSNIFRRVDTLQNEIASLSILRDTLLPRLICGDIRVDKSVR